MKNVINALVVIGARPQFIKHVAFLNAAKGKIDSIVVHTGQHYDSNMSDVFFEELNIEKPKYHLSLGGGNHGYQTGRMMIELEKIVENEEPKCIVVYGDTNSTLAGALVGAKLHIPVVHIEAGLRSHNKKMPEEINRILTDQVSSLLFVPNEESVRNLKNEGIDKNVLNVGDIMKDLVLAFKNNHSTKIDPNLKRYMYVTIHRPYNTDEKNRLLKILDWLNNLSHHIIFSLHPRTRSLSQKFGIDLDKYTNIEFIDPQGYYSNLNYLISSECLITDSGGMQKEAYWLEKKCITVRSETEWKETLEKGANQLVFDNFPSTIDTSTLVEFDQNLYGKGNTADLILDKMMNYII